MAYKIIALDLDDTLLNAKKEVSPENRKVLDRLAETGMHIVLASGRLIQGMQYVLDQIPGHSYTISFGGAVITDKDGKNIYSCSLPPLTAKKIIRYVADHGYYFQIFCNNTFYYVNRTQHTDKYEKSARFTGVQEPEILNWDIVYTSKILIIDSQERVNELRIIFEDMFPDIQIVFSQTGYMEILNTEVSKGKALAHITELLHLEPNEVIAIGDSEIDISMIEYAGLGIAMGDANESVLKIADYITESCEQDGVATAVKKFIFGEEL